MSLLPCNCLYCICLPVMNRCVLTKRSRVFPRELHGQVGLVHVQQYTEGRLAWGESHVVRVEKVDGSPQRPSWLGRFGASAIIHRVPVGWWGISYRGYRKVCVSASCPLSVCDVFELRLLGLLVYSVGLVLWKAVHHGSGCFSTALK